MACSHCGAYESDDDDGYGDTDTEDEADQSSTEYQAYLGDMTGATYEGLRHDYLWSKARFRRFTGRLSRRARFPRRAPWAKGRRKGRAKGHRKSKFPLAYGYPVKGMPAHALAGGKGKAGNPRDPSGAPLPCHGCNSDTHLIAQCPFRKGKGKGKKGKGKSFYEETEDLSLIHI